MNRSIERDVIDAITTHETMFFRDKHPFDYLQNEFFPKFYAQYGRNTQLNIWSAAASTGQEVYSIAFTLKNILRDLSRYKINLTATDISDEVIRKASQGYYNKFELSRGLSEQDIDRYFQKDDLGWRVKDEIRRLIHFKQANLLKNGAQDLAKMDLIFCRNVAIYFSQNDRCTLYNKIADQLSKEGVLIISSTESLVGICDRFDRYEYKKMVFYRVKK